MADVKLGVMPSEGLIWPLAATRELERNLDSGGGGVGGGRIAFSSQCVTRLELRLIFLDDP